MVTYLHQRLLHESVVTYLYQCLLHQSVVTYLYQSLLHQSVVTYLHQCLLHQSVVTYLQVVLIECFLQAKYKFNTFVIIKHPCNIYFTIIHSFPTSFFTALLFALLIKQPVELVQIVGPYNDTTTSIPIQRPPSPYNDHSSP